MSAKASSADIPEYIQKNYDFFLQELPKLIVNHSNEYALIYATQIIGCFDSVKDAYIAGKLKFTDDKFSIQKITMQNSHLGFFSYVMS